MDLEWPAMQIRTLLVAALASSLLAGCAVDAGNFSQYPGFAEWYARNPPAERLPSDADQALLARFAPRFYLPAGHEGPLDFYTDYIGSGALYRADGELVSDDVSPDLLDRWKADPQVVFVHRPAGRTEPPKPTVYGRIDRGEVELPGCAEPLRTLFLTYHLVFRTSGLPAGMTGWQEFALEVAGDLDDWHQLDHYTAVTLAVTDQADPVPFAAIFQHHNYMRTWPIGEAPAVGAGLALPPDGRLEVDVAIRSNELYPHRPERTVRRAVRFLEPDSAVYLVSGEEQPFAAADDVTDPARPIEPELRFLAPSDAFYVFQGWLGERRLLPGRDGPPGADYNTLPAFKPKPVQLMVFLWAEDDLDYLDLLAETYAGGRPGELDLAPFSARFAEALDDARPALATCRSPA